MTSTPDAITTARETIAAEHAVVIAELDTARAALAPLEARAAHLTGILAAFDGPAERPRPRRPARRPARRTATASARRSPPAR